MIRAFLLWAMIKTIFASVPWQRFLRQRAWCMYLLVHIFINCQVSFSFFAERLLMLVVLSSVWLCIFLLMFTCYLWDPGGFKTKTTRKLAWECFCVQPAVAVFQSGSISSRLLKAVLLMLPDFASLLSSLLLEALGLGFVPLDMCETCHASDFSSDDFYNWNNLLKPAFLSVMRSSVKHLQLCSAEGCPVTLCIAHSPPLVSSAWRNPGASVSCLCSRTIVHVYYVASFQEPRYLNLDYKPRNKGELRLILYF